MSELVLVLVLSPVSSPATRYSQLIASPRAWAKLTSAWLSTVTMELCCAAGLIDVSFYIEISRQVLTRILTTLTILLKILSWLNHLTPQSMFGKISTNLQWWCCCCRIVFRPVKMRNLKYPRRSPSLEDPEESPCLSPEYLEIVNFVNNGWSCVKLELEQGREDLSSVFRPDLIWYFPSQIRAQSNITKRNPTQRWPISLPLIWMPGGAGDSIRTSPTDCDILLIPPAEKTGPGKL